MLNGFCHVSMLRPRQFWSLSQDSLGGAIDTIRVGGAYSATVSAIDTKEVKLVIHVDKKITS